jgi:hypothetical protein
LSVYHPAGKSDGDFQGSIPANNQDYGIVKEGMMGFL